MLSKWFCDISIVNSSMYDECNLVDTIEHYLFYCTSVKICGSKVEQWWNERSTSSTVVLTENNNCWSIL